MKEHAVMKQLLLIVVVTFVLAAGKSTCAGDLKYKDRILGQLVEQVPDILNAYDAETGRFGEGIWICRDQHQMYPLAVAYATPDVGNPYHKDPKLLEVIMKAGDALAQDADENGQWVFRKKDGSTWGKIWMPWTYSRWVRTFSLVRDSMPPERRKAWEDALTLGYTGISKNELGHIHNIPTHHAMGLYVAGKVLDRPEWRQQAAEFMMKVIAKQSEGGYWSEGGGPVVGYNFVYVDAIGVYYALSGDKRVLPSLQRAAAFHRHFTYPNGRNVETIDQRNPYSDRVKQGNVGFTFTSIGRAYLQSQWSQIDPAALGVDLITSLLLYGEEGPVEERPSDEAQQVFVLKDDGVERAAITRHGPWLLCLSAYTGPISKSRWIQDRQNLVSIYHDTTGLILGGGNTKLQPAWSNFTVGDPRLLAHTPGDTNPDFLPNGELYHVPSAAELVHQPAPGLDLTYGKEACHVRVRPKDERTLEYSIETTATSDLPVTAHLTLIPHVGQPLETAAGQEITIGKTAVELSADQIGGWVEHVGYRLHVPPSSSLHWPALPHNPYRKDGRAYAGEGRIEIRIPFDKEHRRHQITLEIPE